MWYVCRGAPESVDAAAATSLIVQVVWTVVRKHVPEASCTPIGRSIRSVCSGRLSMGILLSSALDGLNLQIAHLSTAWLMSECRNRPEFSVT